MQRYTDTVTGLADRTALTEALTRAQTLPAPVALLLLDLDRFRLLNQIYGHDAGDALLQQVAKRLLSTVGDMVDLSQTRSRCVVARVGGDEFAVLLADATEALAVNLAERMLKAVAAVFRVGSTIIRGSASIGIALTSHTPAIPLLGAADTALYAAKAGGRGRWMMFDPANRERLQHTFTLEAELRQAVSADELRLHYQPIIALDSGRFAGIEALLRWPHPTRGLIPPGEFVPIAVESGLIGQLGEWAVRQACQDFALLRRLRGAQGPDFVTVNVSRRQLTDPSLLRIVDSAVAAAAITPQQLHIEITEGDLVTDMNAARTAVGALKQLGVALSVDDFGTGYSSLSSLHQFQIDVLKLDRCFMPQELSTPQARSLIAVAHAAIGLARNIGVKIIAEGVETRPQLALLHSLQCDLAQGFLFGRPMPLETLVTYRVPDCGVITAAPSSPRHQ